MVACSGSGRESEVAFAPPQTLPLGWRELDGDHGRGFRLEVRSLRITHDRWAVEASVTNRTGVSYAIDRPHVPGGTKFGLFVIRSSDRGEWEGRVFAGRVTPDIIATRFEPPIPRLLRPGARWSGTFSARGRLRSGISVRVGFGRFRTTETPPPGLPTHLMAVTRSTARIGATTRLPG